MKTIGIVLLGLIGLVILVSGQNRNFVFKNNCREPVWIGATGGFAGNCPCAAGQECRNGVGCFWVLPSSANNRRLDAGQSISVVLTNPAKNNIKWSGNVWGKTGCNGAGQQCQTGDCGSCGPGTGAGGPTTLAEFTLLNSGVDTYDVSLINGVNVGIEMSPLGVFKSNLSDPTADAYFCGNPGGRNPKNNALVGCSWNFNANINGRDLSTYLNVVTPGGRACNSQNCGNGQVCGLTVGSRAMVCGTQIGHWTADEICGYGPYGDPFDCNNGVPGQGARNNLYGCTGANGGSCYQNGAGGNCCGCPRWVVNGRTLPSGINCQNSNQQWTNLALPFANFVKQACPTGYSFPYDDATSTFQCNNGQNPNTVGYQITYCP